MIRNARGLLFFCVLLLIVPSVIFASSDTQVGITFTTPNTYASCVESDTSDTITATGVNSRQLVGQVIVEYTLEGGGRQPVPNGTYAVNQSGDLDLTVSYPPISQWPVHSNGTAEIHVDIQIEAYEDGHLIATFGAGLDWDVFCHVSSTNTPTSTTTNTPTNTPTETLAPPTLTPSNTPTETLVPPTLTPSNTPTETLVPPTLTPSNTPTETLVPPTLTPSNTPTETLVPPTFTPTNTPTETLVPPTLTPSNTPTETLAPPTFTPTNTPTETLVPPTLTPSNTPTNTFVPPTLTPSNTPTNTAVPPTSTPSNTPTSTITNTPTNTPTSGPANGQANLLTNRASSTQECSADYWKQADPSASWSLTGLTPDQSMVSVFTVPNGSGFEGDTLLQALDYRGGLSSNGAAQMVLRSAVTALLNAAHPDMNYRWTPTQVITGVNAALASNNLLGMFIFALLLEVDNIRHCSLN